MTPTDFAKRILRWFDQHGRHNLPWQKKQSPYRVWVSEIMLQQTQVTTVIPYYQRFMKRFPSLKALALADVDDVLAHWSGLGYYARARNLHRTAQIIHTDYRGRFPKKIEGLTALPGIGRSTAGAILSLSMDIPAAILDGNVKRVLTRYHAIEGWTGEKNTLNALWELTEKLTPQTRCGDYNQAMMDLGATLCTRRQPQCMRCPLKTGCQARASERQHDFPTPRKALKQTEKSTFMLLIQDSEGAIFLEKRPSQGIWGGLWSFPECKTKKELAEYCQKHLRCNIVEQQHWPLRHHQFSHFRLAIYPIFIKVKGQQQKNMASAKQIWYKKANKLPGGVAAPVTQLLAALMG